jgi:predicted SnoaL-like aldol condensation-catalyzing enzyme
MTQTSTQRNRDIVLEAFDTLFNKRDYAAAERFWSANYIQHSAHIPPGREGLFHLIRTLPDELVHEVDLAMAEGDTVMIRGRYTGHGQPTPWIVADFVRMQDGQIREHWDIIEDEVTRENSASGLPMFGDDFPEDR